MTKPLHDEIQDQASDMPRLGRKTALAFERPCFRERVAALAGKSAYREPGTGSGTGHMRAIPSDHLVAAALAYARKGPDDIGPDIAFDIATQTMRHKGKICAAVGAALIANYQRDRTRRYMRPFIGNVVWAGYVQVVELPMIVPKPDGMTVDEWRAAVNVAATVMQSLGEKSLQLAERAHKKREREAA
ncbi:hypothetical protein [Dyella caseinilytica]|uniref:Uncharacterized protein n=1 Tax=Dyella caseinilytica TaxID=1849581 RepID=A0ABX7GQS5_9GAMM|nr:hypothetical protein [Dyella caseinilytica]QRN52411.1 hypothetical protein ISN74_13085 [Dyella caseinilytica]GGA05748.1 hypothetical protein GCM10011408_28360 [Dyella caseinilytica]